MAVLNFGSLNIDHVYRVSHIVAPGETLASRSYEVFAGGKGANQSVALARAGAKVRHAGRIGPEGRWLLDKLAGDGIDTTMVRVADEPGGHAIIQVDDQGQNSIILHPGANRVVSRGDMDEALARAEPGSVLLLQNEINEVDYLIGAGRKRGLKVCFNPAPFGPEVMAYPLGEVSLLIVNETEGAGLTGENSAPAIVMALKRRWPDAEIILTRGSEGVTYAHGTLCLEIPAVKVKAVDTTAAGDTFIGYFLAARGEGLDVKSSLELAVKAAAICVSRAGAMDSIPTRAQVPR